MSSLQDRIANGPWDWELAEDMRREAEWKMTPLERLDALEQMMEFIFTVQELNPDRFVNESPEGIEPEE
jgi:hypothetical protein